MTSHASVAASVRARKELHPELFCANTTCLWQIVTPRGPNPCRNHPLASLIAASRVDPAPELNVRGLPLVVVPVVESPPRRVTGCDVCSAPATAMVNAPDHRFHSFRCDVHAREAVAAFAVIQALTTVEPFQRSVQ